MKVKQKNVILAGLILAISFGAMILLFINSSIPIYSVKELMDTPKPETLIGKRIQLVGVVVNMNSSGFYLFDPFSPNDSKVMIYVESRNIEKPLGFENEKTVLVQGNLMSIEYIWRFKASSLSTKCPSKYKTGN